MNFNCQLLCESIQSTQSQSYELVTMRSDFFLSPFLQFQSVCAVHIRVIGEAFVEHSRDISLRLFEARQLISMSFYFRLRKVKSLDDDDDCEIFLRIILLIPIRNLSLALRNAQRGIFDPNTCRQRSRHRARPRLIIRSDRFAMSLKARSGLSDLAAFRVNFKPRLGALYNGALSLALLRYFVD